MHRALTSQGRDGMGNRFWGTLPWPALALPRVPERVPELQRPWGNVFDLLWMAAFAAGLSAPLLGPWCRFSTAGENSALMLGSRAGLVPSQDDLTRVRF